MGADEDRIPALLDRLVELGVSRHPDADPLARPGRMVAEDALHLKEAGERERRAYGRDGDREVHAAATEGRWKSFPIAAVELEAGEAGHRPCPGALDSRPVGPEVGERPATGCGLGARVQRARPHDPHDVAGAR